MAPALTIQNDSDFTPSGLNGKKNVEPRTLLLAPPSVASHPELLNSIFEAYDRSMADLQMLDRLALGLVNLPSSTYDLILLLTDADGTRTESNNLLARDVISKVVQSLKAGGWLRSQDRQFGTLEGPEKTEAILAGLVGNTTGDGMQKPDSIESDSVPLRFGKKKAPAASNGISHPETTPAKRKSISEEPPRAAGVGFVDFSDDLDLVVTGEDDELVDEDDLLTEADLSRRVIQPPECRPKPGKRRRACKDCTCGMKEQIEAEDRAKRAEADTALGAMKLDTKDLAEVDFTVQGKVGSCGNCALGDAFRCDGCPYIGLPAFKPGEEVRLLNNDIQL